MKFFFLPVVISICPLSVWEKTIFTLRISPRCLVDMLSFLARHTLIRAAANADIDSARISLSPPPREDTQSPPLPPVSDREADAHALALCADLQRRAAYAAADGDVVEVLPAGYFAQAGTLLTLKVMLIATGDAPVHEQALFVVRSIYSGSSLVPTAFEARVVVRAPGGGFRIDVTDEQSLLFTRDAIRWRLGAKEFEHASHEVGPCRLAA